MCCQTKRSLIATEAESLLRAAELVIIPCEVIIASDSFHIM